MCQSQLSNTSIILVDKSDIGACIEGDNTAR